MTLPDVELLMKLMNTHGITNLTFNGVVLTCPNPRVPITQQIMSMSPQDEKLVSAITSEKPIAVKQKSAQELEDELLFYHEKFDTNGDI